MTANVGKIDRALRLLLGLVLFVAPLLSIPSMWSSAWLAYASMAVGAVLVVTAFVRFCPLYRVLGLSTCKL
jgi:hypothetical protein